MLLKKKCKHIYDLVISVYCLKSYIVQYLGWFLMRLCGLSCLLK